MENFEKNGKFWKKKCWKKVENFESSSSCRLLLYRYKNLENVEKIENFNFLQKILNLLLLVYKNLENVEKNRKLKFSNKFFQTKKIENFENKNVEKKVENFESSSSCL